MFSRAVKVISFYNTFFSYNCIILQAQVQKSLESLEREKGNEAILGAFSRVRLIAALAKIDATVSLAKNILQKESSVVIFSYFVDVAKQVHKKLNDSGWTGELLVGESLSKDRQAMVDRFQVNNFSQNSTVCDFQILLKWAFSQPLYFANIPGWYITCFCGNFWSGRSWDHFNSSMHNNFT